MRVRAKGRCVPPISSYKDLLHRSFFVDEHTNIRIMRMKRMNTNPDFVLLNTESNREGAQVECNVSQ